MDDAPAEIRLIAGLGNPGRDYERTRHNVGFEVVDRLAAEWKLDWQASTKWGAHWAKGDVILTKPATFMNRSGVPLRAVADFYKITAREIFVIIDDLALPLGRLRLRLGGSSGGHNGLQSVLEHFGTDEVPRLRVGIGASPSAQTTAYVLGRFFDEEKPVLEAALARAAEASRMAVAKGVLAAMNIFNKTEETNT